MGGVGSARRWFVLVGAVALMGVLTPAARSNVELEEYCVPASGSVPAPCPRVYIPLPTEGWVVAGLTAPLPGTEAVYDSLIPEPYGPGDERLIAFTLLRL